MALLYCWELSTILAPILTLHLVYPHWEETAHPSGNTTQKLTAKIEAWIRLPFTKVIFQSVFAKKIIKTLKHPTIYFLYINTSIQK